MITLVEHPKRNRGLIVAALLSLFVHLAVIAAVRNASFLTFAMGLREIEFVEEEYDGKILVAFTKKLKYPPGYLGFRPPEKVRSLEELKKIQDRRVRLEAARRKREEERRKREEEELAKREAEEKAKVEADARAKEQEIAKNAVQPTPTPPAAPSPTPRPEGYGRFGKINTSPIKDQLLRLYEAKKAGTLVLPEGKLKVGVEGAIAPDGTIAKYRLSIRSGIEEIDEAAMAILSAVSESRALGVLHSLTSLSMVLDVDQTAELRVVGFANTDQDAADITNLAQVAIFAARLKKASDPAAMVMLNNLKVTRNGARINAVISVPRQMASDTLSKTMDKGQPKPEN